MKFEGFSFQGRINRAKYWRIKIGIFLANLFFHIWVASQFSHEALRRPPSNTGEWILVGGMVAVTVVSLVVAITTEVKRFHDRDKSGWWVLIAFIPVIGAAWVVIECGFLLGTAGPNRFGADPLQNQSRPR